MKRFEIRWTLSAALMLLSLSPGRAADPGKPNFIVINIDDVG